VNQIHCKDLAATDPRVGLSTFAEHALSQLFGAQGKTLALSDVIEMYNQQLLFLESGSLLDLSFGKTMHRDL
jgi:hypothetical protein